MDPYNDEMQPRTGLYVKLGLLGALALYVLLFVVLNAGNKADVWMLPFVTIERVSVLFVILITALLTLALSWFGGRLVKLLRQLRRASD